MALTEIFTVLTVLCLSGVQTAAYLEMRIHAKEMEQELHRRMDALILNFRAFDWHEMMRGDLVTDADYTQDERVRALARAILESPIRE